MRTDMAEHLLAGLLLAATSGVAHAGANETIADCARSESQNARILCLENALRELTEERIPAPSKAAEAPMPSESSEPPASPPAAAPVAPRPETGAVAEVMPPSSPVESGNAEREIDDSASDELGAEQVAARNDSESNEESILHATVVDFDFVGYRRLLVQLDNGQIWRQIDGDRTNVERGLRNEEAFAVELWGTGLGGYRMRILPLERTIRVERLK